MSGRPPAEQLPALLEPVLQQRIPGADQARIRHWAPSSHGFSTETYLFDLEGPAGTVPLVFRRLPELPLFPDYDLLRQVLVMRRLAGTAIPVPRVRWLDRTGAELGDPYFVMDRLDGDAPSDYPSYHAAGTYFEADSDQRARMWWGCVDVMAEVHRLDWRALNLGFLAMSRHGRGPVEQLVNYLAAAVDWAAPRPPPLLRRAVDWLRTHAYEPERVTLCWGDARISNVLYDNNFRVSGVLDWELARLGDHESDLAWLLFVDWACSDYEGHPRLAGTPSREDTIAYYEQRTGLQVKNLHYNEMLSAVLLAVPLLRLSDRARLPPEMNPTAFCTARIEQLLT
ncbi:phosphotransferase family protein [Nocardia transvalensis]|uniref:phosphotransferase family protein n=1 Tax=Nocardia transvalensis TaxID=37333 RepID=UPI00189473BE|nr:phosphotransferase family protein [Nocardia transvalensis]MBF6329566.1 phosphotransferase family protein [Nocardia transvalensis]